MKPIEERKEAFRQKLCKAFNESDSPTKLEDYPKWLREDFFIYWTTLSNDNGRKMNFEKEKKWNTMLRLATAKRLVYSRDPRWKSKAKVYYQPKRMKEGQMAVMPELVDKFNVNK